MTNISQKLKIARSSFTKVVVGLLLPILFLACSESGSQGPETPPLLSWQDFESAQLTYIDHGMANHFLNDELSYFYLEPFFSGAMFQSDKKLDYGVSAQSRCAKQKLSFKSEVQGSVLKLNYYHNMMNCINLKWAEINGIKRLSTKFQLEIFCEGANFSEFENKNYDQLQSLWLEKSACENSPTVSVRRLEQFDSDKRDHQAIDGELSQQIHSQLNSAMMDNLGDPCVATNQEGVFQWKNCSIARYYKVLKLEQDNSRIKNPAMNWSFRANFKDVISRPQMNYYGAGALKTRLNQWNGSINFIESDGPSGVYLKENYPDYQMKFQDDIVSGTVSSRSWNGLNQH